MAYRARLLNRLEQFGRVYYDLLIDDPDNPQPPLRVAVKFLLAQDTLLNRQALRQAWLAQANLERTVEYRLQRLTEQRDAAIEARQELNRLIARLNNRIDNLEVDP